MKYYILFLTLFITSSMVFSDSYVIKLNDPNSVLNMRESPSIEGRIIAKIPNGEKIPGILKESGGIWGEIQWKGKIGWVSRSYLHSINRENSLKRWNWGGKNYLKVKTHTNKMLLDYYGDFFSKNNIWTDIKEMNISPVVGDYKGYYADLHKFLGCEYDFGQENFQAAINISGIESMTPLGLFLAMDRRILIKKEMLRYLEIPEVLSAKRIEALTNVQKKYFNEIKNYNNFNEVNKKFYLMFLNQQDKIYKLLERTKKYGFDIEFTNECGGGATDVAVSFKTKPPGSKIHFISAFNYLLCENLEINPKNLDACFGWLYSSKNKEYLSGKYFINVQWINQKKEMFTMIEIDPYEVHDIKSNFDVMIDYLNRLFGNESFKKIYDVDNEIIEVVFQK